MMIPIRAPIVALVLAAAPPSASAEPNRLDLELNKLEQVDGSCRAYLVFENQTESAFSEFKLDLVMFGSDGVIAKRMALDAAPLPATKTTVKLFDIADLTCTDLGRILVNDVMSCVDQGGQRDGCIALVDPSARGAVSLVK